MGGNPSGGTMTISVGAGQAPSQSHTTSSNLIGQPQSTQTQQPPRSLPNQPYFNAVSAPGSSEMMSPSATGPNSFPPAPVQGPSGSVASSATPPSVSVPTARQQQTSSQSPVQGSTHMHQPLAGMARSAAGATSAGYAVPGTSGIGVGASAAVGSPPNSNWSGGSTSNATLSYTQNNQASASSYCEISL